MVKMTFFLLICFFFASCLGEKKGDPGNMKGRIIPSINLLTKDSVDIFNTRVLANKGSVVLLFFDPYCPHCRHEIESILRDNRRFGSTQICLITIAPLSDVRRFYDLYKLYNYGNVHIGVDRTLDYIKFFEVKKVPHTSVFSEDKKLIAVFTYGVEASSILSVIR